MFEMGSVRTAAADALDQLAAARAQLAAAEQQLLAADLAALSGEQLLELLDVLEVDARRHAAVGCALIAELADRGVAEEAGYTSAVVLLSERLRIGRREAAGRVRLAADLGPRRALRGERLPARFPCVADAVTEGTVSARHAAVICSTIDRIPGRVADEQPELVAQVESTLLGHARALDPDRLAVLARSVASCLDPDGQLAAERDHQRHRDAILTVRPDGSGRLTASLTGEATAVWQTVLDTLSRPVPGEAGDADRRTPGQRRARWAARRRAAAAALRHAAGRRRHPGHSASHSHRGSARNPHRAGHHRPRRRPERLGLPHARRTARMDPTPLDRPDPNRPPQHLPPRPHPLPGTDARTAPAR